MTSASPGYYECRDFNGQRYLRPEGGLTRRECFAAQIFSALVVSDKKTSVADLAKRALTAAEALEATLEVSA